ncbi:MAG: hydroxymethylglutaryl-CoA lyase, partial [Chloroflexi bacterium]|nr:hydroxymethylglutaryl-CoA lyase [Chloroflexota bacterium]
MSDYLKIYEVGPRDGLQNEATLIDSSQKKELVEGLIAAGLQHIELTSFVHPKAVPQMADADEMMTFARQAYPDNEFIGLVFNQIGYDRALAAGCRAMAFGVSVTETFSQKNTRMSSQRAYEISRDLMAQAKRDGIWTRIYVMTAWVCPFEGLTPVHRTIALAEKLWQLEPDELAIADTIGHANPLDVGRLMEALGRRLGMSRLAVHLHDTQAMG